jgi:hypothetical protein
MFEIWIFFSWVLDLWWYGDYICSSWLAEKGQLVFDVMHKLHDYGYMKRRLEDYVQDAVVL